MLTRVWPGQQVGGCVVLPRSSALHNTSCAKHKKALQAAPTRAWLRQQGGGCVVLPHLPFVEHQDAVAVHDGVQAAGTEGKQDVANRGCPTGDPGMKA